MLSEYQQSNLIYHFKFFDNGVEIPPTAFSAIQGLAGDSSAVDRIQTFADDFDSLSLSDLSR